MPILLLKYLESGNLNLIFRIKTDYILYDVQKQDVRLSYLLF